MKLRTRRIQKLIKAPWSTLVQSMSIGTYTVGKFVYETWLFIIYDIPMLHQYKIMTPELRVLILSRSVIEHWTINGTFKRTVIRQSEILNHDFFSYVTIYSNKTDEHQECSQVSNHSTLANTWYLCYLHFTWSNLAHPVWSHESSNKKLQENHHVTHVVVV